MDLMSTLQRLSPYQCSRRFITFGIIGALVMLAGTGLLYVLVDILHLNKDFSYILQAIFAVNINFILNFLITWSDRRPTARNSFKILKTWIAFILTRLITIIISVIIFSILAVFVHYLLASTISILVSMVFNFTTNDKYVFKSGSGT